MMSEVQALIRTLNFAFKLRDSSLCSTARAELSRDIKQAKEAYGGYRTSSLIITSSIQALTNYKGQSPPTRNSGHKLTKELNTFFTRFLCPPHLAAHATVPTCLRAPIITHIQRLV